jgi:DNA primase
VNNRIPEEIVEDIRLTADIVEIISGYVTLQRKGKNYLGLCPFHSEKTASFTVNAEKQFFHCFGCQAGGNVFSFLMQKENWTFPETMRYLAERYGISLPEEELSQAQQQEQQARQRWIQILNWAGDFFHERLITAPEGALARTYLAERGVSAQMILDFRLGYAPDRWDALIEAMRKHQVQPQELAQAGLAVENSPQKYYDRFRHRVIYSIMDRRKQTIAFGGRVLDDSLPKYLNSPETQFFQKGRRLYGLHQAHQSIREKGFALLAEGYMDVIALHQAGWLNAVASLGTALTKEQAKLLHQITQRVMISYDADAAGIQAALRAGEMLCQEGLQVNVINLQGTGAKDPDELIQSQGEEAFRAIIERAETYVEFKYHTMMTEHTPRTIPEKAAFIARLAPDILAVKSPVEREGYERFLSYELGLTLEAVQREILAQTPGSSKLARKREYSGAIKDISVNNRDTINRPLDPTPPLATVPQGVYQAEWILLRLIDEDHSRIALLEAELGLSFWRIPAHEKIFLAVWEAWQKGNKRAFVYDDEEMLNVWHRILLKEIDTSQGDKIFRDCVRTIHNANVEENVEDLQVKMAQMEKSGDFTGAVALLKQIGERLRRDEK